MSEMKWISVAKRLPEIGYCGYSEKVLITIKDGNIIRTCTGVYEKSERRGKPVERWIEDFCGRIIRFEVAAWMPLPEPYKEED